MCDITSREVSKGKWEIICSVSHKPVTIATSTGMYCEDMCGEEDDKLAGEVLRSMFPLIEDAVFASSEVASRIVGAKNKPKHKNVGRRK